MSCRVKGYILQEGTEELVSTQTKNKYGVRDYDDDEEEEEWSEDEADKAQASTKTWSAVSSFDEVVVWGHEEVPSDKYDIYVTGLRDMVNLSHLVSYCRILCRPF